MGVASARVLVDTPDSQVVDLNPKGADPTLSSRATLLANLMASSPVKIIIARDAGVPPQAFVAVAPVRDGPTRSPRRTPADDEHGADTDIQTEDALPIIAVSAQAPTAEQAARLANAAGTGLRDYLRSVAGAQNVPAARQVYLEPRRGPVGRRRPRRGRHDRLRSFGLACFGVIDLPRRCRSAVLERSDGEDAPHSPRRRDRPSPAQSLRRRSWPGRTPTGGERSAAADERLAG